MVSNLAFILGKSFKGSESPGEASACQEVGTKPGALTQGHVLGENTWGLIAEPAVHCWCSHGATVGKSGGGLPPSFPDLDCTKAAAVLADFPKLQSDLKLYPRVVGQPAQSALEDAQYPCRTTQDRREPLGEPQGPKSSPGSQRPALCSTFLFSL